MAAKLPEGLFCALHALLPKIKNAGNKIHSFIFEDGDRIYSRSEAVKEFLWFFLSPRPPICPNLCAKQPSNGPGKPLRHIAKMPARLEYKGAARGSGQQRFRLASGLFHGAHQGIARVLFLATQAELDFAARRARL